MFPRTGAARTSVGCPFRCSFCVVHYLARGKYVRRTPEDAVNEIVAIPEEHVYFLDDEMFIDAERVTRIAQRLLERGVRKHYVSWARADTIVKHPEVFKLWKEAGLTLIYVGLESMEPDNLQDYNKHVSPEVNRQAVAILREPGYRPARVPHGQPGFHRGGFRQGAPCHQRGRPRRRCRLPSSLRRRGQSCGRNTGRSFAAPIRMRSTTACTRCCRRKCRSRSSTANLSMLWLCAARNSPLLRNKVKVPLKDRIRFFYSGFWYGCSVQHIYMDYCGRRRR